MRNRRDINLLMRQANKLADQIQKKLDRKKKIDDRIKALQGRCDHTPMPPDKKGEVYCAKCGFDMTPKVEVSDAAKKGIEALQPQETPSDPVPVEPTPEAPQGP